MSEGLWQSLYVVAGMGIRDSKDRDSACKCSQGDAGHDGEDNKTKGC